MPDIFSYYNYRTFLADTLAERKINKKKLSLRRLATALELNVSTLSRIMRAQRNLTPGMVEKVVRYFRLPKRKKVYFKLLVACNQQKNPRARLELYDKLWHFRNEKLRYVPGRQEQFYSEWFYSAIRELVNIYPHPHHYRKISSMTIPRVSVPNVKKAVGLLEELGFIRRIGSRYELAGRFISAGKEVSDDAMRRFQVSMIGLAVEAIKRVPPSERDLSTLTLSLSESAFERTRTLLEQTRTMLLSIAEADSQPERVFQVNLHLFPLSKKKGAR
jgi:uncharacterized protein (TIGR02147 family)